MAESLVYNGVPKGVVGNIARDTTNRPAKLRLRATDTVTHESTIGTNGERRVRSTRASRNR